MKRVLRFQPAASVLLLGLVLAASLSGQYEGLKDANPKKRAGAAKSIGNSDRADPAVVCPLLGELLRDPDLKVRRAAVVALIKTGTQHSLPPLIQATRNPSPDLQSLGVDGLVNFYYFGYVKFGWINSVSSFGKELKSRFSRPAPMVIEPYVAVSPDVVQAIMLLITGGSSLESRANAARAVGILRGRAAIPTIEQGLRSKNSMIIIECVRALEKIGEANAGPSLVFLLRDLDPKVQLAVVEASGQLLVKDAIPDLIYLIRESEKKEIRRQAMISLAKIPDNQQADLFKTYLREKDKQMRAGAAEGLGRTRDRSALPLIQSAFAQEGSESARLSQAFAAVSLGELAKLDYLIDGLNSKAHRGEARPFLVELARDPAVLERLHRTLAGGTKDQKIHLAYVLGASGTRESLAHLQRLSEAEDLRVAQAAVTALKNLQARL